MKFIDSHCHLDFEPLSKNVESILSQARLVGVEKIINIGSSFRSSEKSIYLAQNYPSIWATVGMHPHDAETTLDLEGQMEKITELSGEEKVVAIGEIGLDYYNFSDQRSANSNQKNKQKKLFNAQLEIAQGKKLPVVFHVRDAWEDFFKIIENWKSKTGSYPRGVVHCFTGDEKAAKRVVSAGLFIGFTGFITFEQSKFDQIKKACVKVPLEKILIETDAPFLAPEPYRGKTNEPSYVVEVAKKISELKKVSLEKVAQKTTKNAEDLFGI